MFNKKLKDKNHLRFCYLLFWMQLLSQPLCQHHHPHPRHRCLPGGPGWLRRDGMRWSYVVGERRREKYNTPSIRYTFASLALPLSLPSPTLSMLSLCHLGLLHCHDFCSRLSHLCRPWCILSRHHCLWHICQIQHAAHFAASTCTAITRAGSPTPAQQTFPALSPSPSRC